MDMPAHSVSKDWGGRKVNSSWHLPEEAKTKYVDCSLLEVLNIQ